MRLEMMISLIKVATLCCILILSTATQEVSEDKLNQKEKEDNLSRNSALVALDVEVEDEEDEVSTESFIDKNAESFIPTHEWQIIKPGQAIPKGLHVRLNLQTGEREAKLMDNDHSNVQSGYYKVEPKNEKTMTEDARLKLLKDELEKATKELQFDQTEGREEDGMKYWKQKDREGMVNLKKSSFTHDELKQALKKFKSERDDVQDPNVAEESAKTVFRTMEEIREDFRFLNMDMKTDLEILTDIMKKYKTKTISESERLALLMELEYHVHQIDNAQNFADMDGLDFVILDLNSTSEEIRKAAALVLASAMQSNPKVQVSAIESGAMQKLIRMISVESSVSVRVRSLTALSSLIRSFPYAQLKFLELGGLDALTLVLKQPEISEKLCVKAVTLINDLLVEQISAREDEHVSAAVRTEKLNQYSRIHLLESILEHGWCSLVPKLLDLSDHDAKEKVLSMMWILRDSCQTDFLNILPRLKALQKEYEDLSAQEMEEEGFGFDESYFASVLLESLNRMVNHISQRKDEL